MCVQIVAGERQRMKASMSLCVLLFVHVCTYVCVYQLITEECSRQVIALTLIREWEAYQVFVLMFRIRCKDFVWNLSVWTWWGKIDCHLPVKLCLVKTEEMITKLRIKKPHNTKAQMKLWVIWWGRHLDKIKIFNLCAFFSVCRRWRCFPGSLHVTKWTNMEISDFICPLSEDGYQSQYIQNSSFCSPKQLLL
jgi:hypothetical protein